MICISCGKEIISSYVNCPHCGYRFTVDEFRTCPNSNYGICSITEIPCTMGINFMRCRVKAEAEGESII